ncbi:carbon-nitrogen hydrolase family protein [Glutamicibacter endophyticus]|uniref:carbon-nitrogen hydrolase family protein n=1 Tax=Glutamicibacter endophyticus TaxID=1522174 RepID=UPI003AEF314B
MKIALAQILSSPDPADNLDLIRDHVSTAAAQGAELVVFPEATMCAFGNDLTAVAEHLDGPWANTVRRIAEEHQVTVVVGMFTPGEQNRVRNTLLITGGGIEAHYDKIHLYDAFGYRESESVTAGSLPVQFTLNGITFGVATCYDVRFPELFFRHAQAEALVNIVCASWASGPGKAEQWQLATRARAMDSTTFVAAVDQADPYSVEQDVPPGVPLGVGHSALISPLGEVIEDLGVKPGMRIVTIDPEQVDAARTGLPVLANARLR